MIVDPFEFSRIFSSVHRNTDSTRITRAAVEFPRARDFRRMFLLRSNLNYRRGREGRGSERGIEPSIRTCIRYTGVSCTLHIHKRDACTRGDRAPQVSLGPHRHNTFTDVTPHSKLLRCRRTRISSLPPFLPLPMTAPGERDTAWYTHVCKCDAHARTLASPRHLAESVREILSLSL